MKWNASTVFAILAGYRTQLVAHSSEYTHSLQQRLLILKRHGLVASTSVELVMKWHYMGEIAKFSSRLVVAFLFEWPEWQLLFVDNLPTLSFRA